jgi:hypothetical protein
MRGKVAVLFLMTSAAILPHAALCARFWPLSTLLELGVLTELAHIAVHALLFGLLAAALSACLLAETASPRTLRLRAGAALAYFGLVMSARQAIQVLVRGARPGAEEVLEVSLDGVAGALGLVGWALADPAAARRVARALGWLFHPALIAPLGFFALCWTHCGGALSAAKWTALVALFELPAICVWLLGVRRARFSDADVSTRHERPPLILFCALCAFGLVLGTVVLDAPRIVVLSAVGATTGGLAAALITQWGLKLSAHVATASGAAFALLPNAPRGALVFALVALMLVWARVRDERHKPAEVLAGCVLAALVVGVSLHSF